MYELKLRGDGIVDSGRHSVSGGTSLKYPRSYAELRLYARRHPAIEAREAVGEVHAKVAEFGWNSVKQSGEKWLEPFYEAATEIFNEVANAALGIKFQPGSENLLIARWEFRYPVEDIVLNLLNRRHPTRRLVLVDGKKAFVRDGFGVRMESSDAYAPEVAPGPSKSKGREAPES